MGNTKIGIYCYLVVDILTKGDDWFSTKYVTFVQTSHFDWLSGQQKG